ncbi:MAG TPA: flagellum-specific ATP synthase FliI, partial [Desulfosarcina sp.]|nr:flagellum-specific ATP synthase FliI [Desulfosarcina sp.]
MQETFSIAPYHELVQSAEPILANGRVKKVVGLVVEASGPASQIGCVCDIVTEGGAARVSAEVLGFREDSVLLMPLEDIRALGPGCKVVARREKAHVGVGRSLLGRVIDGLG